MNKYITLSLLTLLALIFWPILVFFAAGNGFFHTYLAPRDNLDQFVTASKTLINQASFGNYAFALIKDEKVYTRHFHSSEHKIDENTLFQVASLSKWITAWGVMALVEQGQLDLDKPVASYLKRWKLPDSQYDNNAVTARLLLSHTAGLDDRLGYAGFDLGKEIQTLESSLDKTLSSSGSYRSVKLGLKPGTQFKYSGGGYTILQLLIEEVSGLKFIDFMQQTILQPLGMTNTTYRFSDINNENIATLYNADGSLGQHKEFTAVAAACLYTSLSDLSRFILAHTSNNAHKAVGSGVLKPETVKFMRQSHAASYGLDIWGLGVMLYVENRQGDFIIGHGGKRNKPSINASARFNPSNGDGIIVLTTGKPLLATTIGSEWSYWQSGQIDLIMFKTSMKKILAFIISGWAIILALGLFGLWKIKSR